MNNVLVSSRELPELFRGIVSTLERVIHHDYTSLALLDPFTGLLKIYSLDFPGRQHLIKPEVNISREMSPSGDAIATGKPVCVRGAELNRYPSEVMLIFRHDGMQAICCIPLTTQGRTFGTLNVASRRNEAFPGTKFSCCNRWRHKSPSRWKTRWRLKKLML